MTGRCSCCGKPDSKFGYIGTNVRRFYCSEACREQLLHEYYENKRKADEAYYSNIPQYDDDDGWDY
jgi:hypothetical protein